MSNGVEDLTYLKNVSLTLLDKVMRGGPQLTRNLSAYAKNQKEKQPLTALTSDFSPVCQSVMKLSAKEKKRLRTAYRGLEAYSMNELAELDKRGIKVIGTDFDYDLFSSQRSRQLNVNLP